MVTPRNNDIFKTNIPHRKWNNPFKGIFSDGNSDNSKLPPDGTQKGPLDGEMSMTELHKATYILKLNKASGYDVICNEMILCLYQTQPELLLKLFNSVFNEAGRIEQWAVSMVIPLFKSGSRGDPSNYRGISVMSCLCKLFCSILNLRLTQYVMGKNILKS